VGRGSGDNKYVCLFLSGVQRAPWQKKKHASCRLHILCTYVCVCVCVCLCVRVCVLLKRFVDFNEMP
jgi:hypothetical protein